MVEFMSGQTETHSLGSLSVADSASTSGEDRLPQNKQSTGKDSNRRPKNLFWF